MDLPPSFKEETGRKILDAIVRKNSTQAADEADVGKSTVYRYKEHFEQMGPVKRNLIIAQLALKNLFEELSMKGGENSR